MSDLSAFPTPSDGRTSIRVASALFAAEQRVKVSIMIEEIGLPTKGHLVDFGNGRSEDAGFLSTQAERQIPASRSQRSRRQAAAAVRVRRDCNTSAEKTGKFCRRTPRALITRSMVHFQ